MYGLLPHEERRMRRGFGMSGFPGDGRKGGKTKESAEIKRQ